MSDISELTPMLEGIENALPEDLKAQIQSLQPHHEALTGSGTAKLTLKTDGSGKVSSTCTPLKSTAGVTVSLAFEITSPDGQYPTVTVESVDSNNKTLTSHSWSNSKAGVKSPSENFSTSFWHKTKFCVSGDAGSSHANTEVHVTVYYSY